MYIVVNHDISNTSDFWASAQKSLPNLPEGGVQKIVSVLPNATMDKCVCVWQADSIETLDSYLREKVGDWSKDSYYELNEAAAMGFTK